MEDFEDPFFDEERLATSIYYDKKRDLIFQLLTESVCVINIQELDTFYKELKPSIIAFWENDLVEPVSANKSVEYLTHTYSFSERGPATLAYLFKFIDAGLYDEKPEDANIIHSLVIIRIFENSHTYHESPMKDEKKWIRGIYDSLMEKAGLS